MRDPLLVISLRVRVTLALGVLFLMAAEPTFAVTMLTIGVAFFVGVLISVPAWTHRGPDPL
jgi:hypothetical protein